MEKQRGDIFSHMISNGKKSHPITEIITSTVKIKGENLLEIYLVNNIVTTMCGWCQGGPGNTRGNDLSRTGRPLCCVPETNSKIVLNVNYSWKKIKRNLNLKEMFL